MKFGLILLFHSIFFFSFAQKDSVTIIEGRLQDVVSKESVPFARVYNKTAKQGTISSETGYFRIAVASENDSVEVKTIGYRTIFLKLDFKQTFYLVEMEPSTKELAEVEIQAESDAYLFEMLQKCRQFKKLVTTGKSYFRLSSYYDTTQIELVEAYSNLNATGYDIETMDLKAGRLALKTFNDRYFTSQGGTQAITQLKLFDKNEYFPQTPLNMGSREGKKLFRLELNSAYLDEKRDSIYVINYRPKIGAPKNFHGKIWLNVTNKSIEKITMNCLSCENHPFLPLFPIDTVKDVDLNITKTFASKAKQMVFNHINFKYKINYVSRPKEQEENPYFIETTAVLYAYNFEEQFQVPKFDFKQPIVDYRKINAFPYNSFFWKNNNEYDLNDQNNETQRFFDDSSAITNVEFFRNYNSDWKSSAPMVRNRRFFESPFVHWSGNRVFLREMIADSTVKAAVGQEKSLLYNLEVQIYLDVNLYNDSLHILTKTVFDPYETYYYLPMDVKTNCFINMYFDLCEIQRRKLEDELRKTPDASPSILENIYDQFMLDAKKQQALFLKEVDRGTTEKAMQKWNEYILKEIGIDNVSLFQLTYEN